MRTHARSGDPREPRPELEGRGQELARQVAHHHVRWFALIFFSQFPKTFSDTRGFAENRRQQRSTRRRSRRCTTSSRRRRSSSATREAARSTRRSTSSSASCPSLRLRRCASGAGAIRAACLSTSSLRSCSGPCASFSPGSRRIGSAGFSSDWEWALMQREKIEGPSASPRPPVDGVLHARVLRVGQARVLWLG